MTEFSWTPGEVERALEVRPRGEPPAVYTEVSTDTRRVLPGALFVALEGASFDGHAFLGAAHAAGARGAVVRHVPEGAPAGLCYYVVDNTLHALGRLGRHRRRALTRCTVVAVAGSNGKTTTKELLRAALGGAMSVHATQGNLNNQVGVPLTLLATPPGVAVLVVETGTNEPGEMDLLGAIVEPDIIVITSIGEEHLEGLGSLEGVLEEELAIVPHLRPDGLLVVAEEPAALLERAAEGRNPARLRVAGFGPHATVRPDEGHAVTVFPDGSTHWHFRRADVHLPLPGMHNVRNALLALAVADHLRVSPETAAAGLARMPQPDMRGEWRQVGSLRVLADCYNANPPSTRAAVDLLASLPVSTGKVAVLGTMRELGEASEGLHHVVGELALNHLGRGIDRLVATGEFVGALAESRDPRVIRAEDPLEAYAQLRPQLNGNETILLKGSRGVALERLLPLLERDFGAGDAPQGKPTAHAGG